VIVASGRRVAGAVTLTTGLDPDKGVDERGASVGSGAGTETSTNGVAPVAPLELASGLLARAALVDDELGGEAIGAEERAEGLDVALLVKGGVGRGVRGGRRQTPGVIVGNVGGKATDRSRRASILVNLGEEVGSRPNVGGPSEPTGVAGIHVHGNMRKVELLERVDGQLLVGAGGALALGHVHVGNHIGERIGLNDEDGANIGEGNELAADLVNVRLVVLHTTVGNGKLAVGGGGSAVAVRKIIDDNLGGIRGVGASSVGSADLIERLGQKRRERDVAVEPLEAGNLGDSRGLGRHGACQARDG